jgi:hypothetical protein
MSGGWVHSRVLTAEPDLTYQVTYGRLRDNGENHMANRVMAAKARKLQIQNRKLPRRLSMSAKGPSGPNQAMLAGYHHRAQGVGDVEPKDVFKGTPAGKHDINTRKDEILHKFDDPLFVEHIDNPFQRIRIFFNSRQDCVIIQQWDKRLKRYRLSIAYSCIEDAYTVLDFDSVSWRIEKPIPESVGG